MNGSSPSATATVQKAAGTTLLWTALSAVAWVPTSGGGETAAWVAGGGFVAFALGLWSFSEGLKRDIVSRVARRGPPG